MSILIALVPALAWGSVGIVTTKAGGTAAQGIMGMTIGAILLFRMPAWIMHLIHVFGW